MILARTALSVALLAGLASSQAVFVVADDGSGDFTDLAAAVDAAPDGSTLLVRSSLPFQLADLEGKSMVILDDGAGVIPGALRVADLASVQSVVVRGLSVQGPPAGGIDFASQFNLGSVLFEDVTTVGGDASFGLDANNGSGPLVVVRSQITGGASMPSQFAGDGMRVFNMGWVAAYDSVFAGGDAGASQSGGDGIFCMTDGLLLSGCTVTGGAGGPGFTGLTSPAVFCLPDQFQLRLIDTDLSSGPGANPGPALVEFGGTLISTPAVTPRHLDSDTGVREGQSASVDYEGVPGETVGLFGSLSTTGIPLGLEKGLLHLTPPLLELAVGTADGDGAFSVAYVAPTLPVGVDAVTLVVQAIGQAGSGLRFSNPTAVTLLDASF